MPKGSNYDAYARRVAKKYGIPVAIFLALGSAESGRQQYRPDGSLVTSSAGALGWGQLMPETAKGLGVDPTDPRQNIEGAARYLRQQIDRFGSLKLALAAYNAGPGNVESGEWEQFPETRSYVAKILGLAGGDLLPAGAENGSANASADIAGTLASARPKMDRSAFTQQVLAENDAIASGEYDPVQASADLVRTLSSAQPAEAETVEETGFSANGSAPVATGGNEDWRKWVDTSDKRTGPSAPHTPEILSFVGQVGRLAGTKLKVWGNESHSLTTVHGTPSAHATGHAADIPATDLELRRIGRAALVAAGMDPKEAAKAKGGIYNLNGYQVIFATDQGGNHWDHVHVGLRGRH